MKFEKDVGLTDITPVDLASEFNINLTMEGAIDTDERFAGVRTTRMLQDMAEFDQLSLVGKDYIVRSRRSMLLPQVIEPGADVDLIDFNDLTFEGTFSEFAIVRIRKMMGRSSLRSLCLEFSDVTLLPGFDKVEESMTMFVAVHDVTSIEGTAA